MKKMIDKQRGITFLGLCFIAAIFGVFVLLGVKLYPLFYEKFRVVSAMNSVADQAGSADYTEKDAEKFFQRNVQISGSQIFDDQATKEYVSIEKPTKKGEPRLLRVAFETRNTFFDDIEFVLAFDKTVPLGKGAVGGNE